MTLKLILGALGALNAFFAVVNLYIGITGPSPLNFVVGVVNAAIAAAIIYAAAEVQMDGVKIIAAEPQVQITFTADEFRGLYETILGRGVMRGAWHKLREANRALEATTAPRSFPRF